MMADAEGGLAPQSFTRKRPLDLESAFSTPVKADIILPASSSLSTPLGLSDQLDNELQSSVRSARRSSPTPSTNTSVTGDLIPSVKADRIDPTQNPAKRRKLTPQEKLEKEEERKRKAEKQEREKQAKELEGQQKAEERRKKAEEREERRRAKEIEAQEREKKKLEKEATQKEREEAIQRKERSQLRLSSFFTGVRNTPTSPAKAGEARRNSLTLDPIENSPPSPYHSPEKGYGQHAEYRKTFLPFNVASNTTLPPSTVPSALDWQSIQCKLDVHTSGPSVADLTMSQHASPYKRSRGFIYAPIKELLKQLEGGEGSSIDLTTDAEGSYNMCVQLLRETPIKYLYFSEDVRPPYCGTWTKPLLPQQWRTLSRNPSKKILEILNYNYDSEAEWEEPEEGEELDSDGEEDLEEEDDDDDMDGFVDDENDSGPTRRPNATELHVQSSGLCWEQPSGAVKRDDGFGEAVDLAPYQMEILLDPLLRTVDPFAVTYWEKVPRKVAPILLGGQTRLPLGSTPNGINRQILPVQTATGVSPSGQPEKKPAVFKPPKRFVKDSDMEAFKQAVKGRTETKQQLVPLLHSLFQKRYTKDVIAATLSHVASRNTLHKQWFLLEMPAVQDSARRPCPAPTPGPID